MSEIQEKLTLCSVTVKKTIPEGNDEWYKIEMTAERYVPHDQVVETKYALYDQLEDIVETLTKERKSGKG